MTIVAHTFSNLAHQLDTFGNIFQFVWFAILPPVLYWLFRIVWDDYISGVFLAKNEMAMIELVPPRDIEKSPLPMELIFAGLQGVYSTPSTYDQLCMGVFTLPFSLEIMGTNGQVRFFIRFPRQFRTVLESHLYAQYPEVEILEVMQDYTESVPGVVPNREWDLWGSDLALSADDAVPIKTWKYFEEDVTGKMVDPLSGLIEVFGSTRPNEHMWLQILATPQKETWYNTGKEYVDKLKGKEVPPPKNAFVRFFDSISAVIAMATGKETASAEKSEDIPLDTRLSPVEKKVLEAVEENIGRYVFKIKMRMVYTAKKEVFDKTMVSGFFGAIKQFADFNLNSLKPDNSSKTFANYILRKTRLRFRQHQILDRYRKRSGMGTTFYLSDRELATLYHMPDMSVVAPAIVRTGTTQATAPANLPVD